jgi:hypothetical protein
VREHPELGAQPLLAYRRGEDTKDALLGAMMESEFQATMIRLAEGWFQAHTKK